MMRLRGAVRRACVGIAWSAAGVTVILAGASLVILVVLNGGRSPFPVILHTRGEFLTLWPALIGSTLVTVAAMLGGLVAARRPGNPIGWLLCVGAVLGGGFYCTYQYAVAAWLSRPGALPLGTAAAWFAQWLWVPVFGVLVFIFLCFPDGRLPSARWRPAARFVAGGFTALTLLQALAPGDLSDLPVHNPLGVGALAALTGEGATGAAFLWPALVGTAVTSVVARFRRAFDVERQQLKCLLAAAMPVPVAVVIYQLQLLPWPAPMVFFLLAVTAVPCAIGLAVLRHGLYEIDRVISRTVSYALLTVLLIAVYLGAVFGLQQLLRPIIGESQLAVAGATLAVAALFQPARRRVQVVVDRRFNRARYDAQRTVDEFRARLRDEVDLAQLDAELVGAVQKTVEPAEVSVWLLPRKAATNS